MRTISLGFATKFRLLAGVRAAINREADVILSWICAHTIRFALINVSYPVHASVCFILHILHAFVYLFTGDFTADENGGAPCSFIFALVLTRSRGGFFRSRAHVTVPANGAASLSFVVPSLA
jgi:hypothetical protein